MPVEETAVEVVTTTVASTTTVDYAYCVDNGTSIADGENVPSSDPCKLCNCDQVNTYTQFCTI